MNKAALRNLWIGMLCLCVAGCATPAPPAAKVTHVVVCWLKSPGSKADRDRLIEVSRSFRDVPGVLEVQAGGAVPSERPIVDDSFDVAICMRFASPGDLAAYLAHPVHLKATQEVLLPLVRKVVVYDIQE